MFTYIFEVVMCALFGFCIGKMFVDIDKIQKLEKEMAEKDKEIERLKNEACKHCPCQEHRENV